ncbi:MAG: bifunctional 5,10-methylenetetrahydrofolate dehydrogenase/5,10-methenyltetrahydrofolate cyclohydrolase [Clostridiales bacterium]|nr:bifunctional 5,10-methylenetetrahydrofolate dehydrogenase/5,10-methenyltetrahydrofolate cyclohydrolase [Clostridiales bacterium]
MATLIRGKEVAAEVLKAAKNDVDALLAQGVMPCLAVILVGDDPASRVYVNKKKEKCEELGIRSLEYKLPAEATQEELLRLIGELNGDKSVHGILCQLPLPKHLDEQLTVRAVAREKDVDGFTCLISSGGEDLMPCTPAGVMEMLKFAGISPRGKKCCVIGRSNIVGKPMAMLLLGADGTVTVCHSKTENLPAVTREADILIAAVGKPRFVTADMVKDGAVVIDVGVNRGADGKLLGDVDFDAVEPKASYITPVPGGVGPMTIAMLMKNTVRAAKAQSRV